MRLSYLISCAFLMFLPYLSFAQIAEQKTIRIRQYRKAVKTGSIAKLNIDSLQQEFNLVRGKKTVDSKVSIADLGLFTNFYGVYRCHDCESTIFSEPSGKYVFQISYDESEDFLNFNVERLPANSYLHFNRKCQFKGVRKIRGRK